MRHVVGEQVGIEPGGIDARGRRRPRGIGRILPGGGAGQEQIPVVGQLRRDLGEEVGGLADDKPVDGRQEGRADRDERGIDLTDSAVRGPHGDESQIGCVDVAPEPGIVHRRRPHLLADQPALVRRDRLQIKDVGELVHAGVIEVVLHRLAVDHDILVRLLVLRADRDRIGAGAAEEEEVVADPSDGTRANGECVVAGISVDERRPPRGKNREGVGCRSALHDHLASEVTVGERELIRTRGRQLQVDLVHPLEMDVDGLPGGTDGF